MKNVLLYFGKSPEKKEHVCKILEDLNLRPIVVDDNDTSQSVGYLFQLPGFSNNETNGMHIPLDLMLFEDAEDDIISEFNKFSSLLHCEMKQKAMLTRHNQNWKLCDLLYEIEKEHAYFGYVEKIHTILNQSQHLIIDDYTKESWSIYEKAFYQAYDALQKEQTLEEITKVYETLNQAKDALKKK